MSSSAWQALPQRYVDSWTAADPDLSPLLSDAIQYDPSLVHAPEPARPEDRDTLILLGEGHLSAATHKDALERGLWGRWWTFADGLHRATRLPDLHTIAGILRAWDEELARLEQSTTVLADPGTPDADLRELALWIMARGGEDHSAVITDEASLGRSTAREALNNLIHPNHLGHLAVLEPHKPHGVAALLEVSIDLGHRAGRLPVMVPLAPVLRPTVVAAEPVRALIPRVVELAEHIEAVSAPFGDNPLDVAVVLEEYLAEYDAPQLTRPLGNGRSTLDELMEKFDRGNAPTPALEALQHPIAVLGVHHARALVFDCEAALQTWKTTPEDLDARLDYLWHLASAVHGVLLARAAFHTESLVRALADENPLPVRLATRAVIEHDLALTKAMDVAHSRFVRIATAPRGDLEAEIVDDVEHPLLRLLFAGRFTDDSSPLLDRASELGARKTMDIAATFLRTANNAVPDQRAPVWESLSGAIHGSLGALNVRPRGLDLAASRVGLLALADSVATPTVARRTLPTANLCEAIRALRNALAAGTAPQREVNTQRLPARLWPGRHYLGTGTIDDPYVLMSGVFLEGYQPLLRHLGVGEHERLMVQLPDGRRADQITTETETIYVVARDAMTHFAKGDSETPG